MLVEVKEMSERKQLEPLFYVQQPAVLFPKANMQELYSSKKDDRSKQKQVTQLKEKSNTDNLFKEVNKNEEKIQEIQEAYDSRVGEAENKSSMWTRSKRGYSFQRVKSFKEMDTIERLSYLVNLPKQLPPVPCVFEIDEQTIKGTLIGKTDDFIEILQLDKKIKTVPINAVNEVRMIGIGR